MLVSVFIPTYNADAALLDATLLSVLNQTYKNIEIWCVDDASTDNTPQNLDKWAKKDKRINVIHKGHEGDVPHSWNHVLEKLKGGFTLYLSHDDILAYDCIERLVRKQQEADYDCVIPTCVGFRANWLHPEDEFSEFNKRSRVKDRTSIRGIDAFFLMLDYSIPGFALWRTNLIKNLGMPTESFNSDECMQRIWISRCNEVAFEDNAKFYYRMVGTSITKGLKTYHYGSLITLKRICERAEEIKEISALSSDNIKLLNKFRKYAIRNQIYLSAQYIKNKNKYNMEEKTYIQDILNSSCHYLFPYLPKFIINFISWVFSKKI